MFPKASIYCFEPDPRARASFLRRIGEGRVQLSISPSALLMEPLTFDQSGGNLRQSTDVRIGIFGDRSESRRGIYELAPWVTFDSVIKVNVNCRDVVETKQHLKC
jgi:hypothetical protein